MSKKLKQDNLNRNDIQLFNLYKDQSYFSTLFNFDEFFWNWSSHLCYLIIIWSLCSYQWNNSAYFWLHFYLYLLIPKFVSFENVAKLVSVSDIEAVLKGKTRSSMEHYSLYEMLIFWWTSLNRYHDFVELTNKNLDRSALFVRMSALI